MANSIIKRIWNQNKMVNIEALQGMAFQAEDGGHTFEISGVDDHGNPVALSGTVAGIFRRPDNADIALTGTASDGVVSVTLTDSCYTVPGKFGLTIYTTADSKKTAVYAAIGTVASTSGGAVAGDTPQDVVDLVNAIAAAVATIPPDYTDLMAAFAPTYSPSGLYPVGAYAWYGGVLYRCTTAITTAETWTSWHWTAAVLGNDVGKLKSAVKVNFRDLNSYNLLDNFDKRDREAHGVKWEWNGGSVYAHGTATEIENLNIFSSSSSMPEGFTAGETYKVKYNSANISLRIIDYTSGAVQIASFKADGVFTIPETCQGLIIRLNISDGANVDETVTPIIYNTATNTELYNSIETLKHNAGTIKEILDEKKEYFEQGGINNSGENTDYGKISRIRTVMIHKAIDVFSLYVSTSNYPKAAMYIHFYDENGGYVGNSEEWITEYTFTKGEVFRIVLTLDKTSVSGIYTVDDIFDEIFTDNTTSRVVKMVSHQGNVNSDSNQCKVAGYKLAGKSGFDYGECDIKFTSDDVPVCCHDATFVDSVSGQTIVIASTTYADLIQYNYYGGTIASLDDVVRACKEAGIGLYIDQYVNSFGAGRVQAVFDVLNKYRFARNVKHIVYSETPALRILECDPHAWIVAGQSHSSPDATAAIALANAIKTESNKVDVMLWKGLEDNVIETALRSMSPEYGLNIYRCDSREDKIAMMPYATSITTNMSSSLYIE